MSAPDLALELYPAILCARAEPLAADFCAEPVLDTPRTGAVSGHSEYLRFVREELEENLASWGQLVFARNTAGLAVYEYDEDRGLLTAARVYDDIPDTPFTHPDWIYRNWSRITAALGRYGCALAYQPEPGRSAQLVELEYFTAPRRDLGPGA